MRNVQLVCTILLISSGCILASPSHRRAAAAGHWGSDTISTEHKEEADNAVINDQGVKNNPVNNFPTTENVDKPPIQAVADDENEDANENNSEDNTVVVPEEEDVEVDTPFPNVGKIQDIIEAGNSEMLGKVDLRNVGEKDVLIAREKDGDYHIHIRVPAEKAPKLPDTSASTPDIGDSTGDEEETNEDEEATNEPGFEATTEPIVSATTEDKDLVSDKGKSDPAEDKSKPEAPPSEQQQGEQSESTSWFRYNDGTLNYLAILAVMFFLFI